MPKKWTRRKFLGTGLAGSLAASGVVVVRLSTLPGRAAAKQQHFQSPFASDEREFLRAVMDEIIPASDGMPAASEVGCLEYVDRASHGDADISSLSKTALKVITQVSRSRFNQDFVQLSRSERVQALGEMERQAAPEVFRNLRDYVYEAYYTQAQVWELIGYNFYPTHQAGPRMKPFDEGVLAKVRSKAAHYREVE